VLAAPFVAVRRATLEPTDALREVDARVLSTREDEGAVARVLAALHRRYWLLCTVCDTVYTTRLARTLVRLPGRPLPPDECAGCGRWHHSYDPTEKPTDKKPPWVGPGIGLLPEPGAKPSAARWTYTGPPQHFGSWANRKGVALREYATLWRIMEAAGFTRLGHPIGQEASFARLHGALARLPLDPARAERGSLADVALLPDQDEPWQDAIERVRATWALEERPAQLWAFAVLEERPRSKSGRFLIELDGGRAGTLPLALNAHLVSVPRSTGPYVAFLRCGWDARGRLRPDRLVLQAIATAACPVPVESSHERAAVWVLQDGGWRFWKPMWDYPAPGLRPDFVVYLRIQVLLEIQGSDDPVYRKQKAEVHARMAALPHHVLVAVDADARMATEIRRGLRDYWRVPPREGPARRR
jgi:hypothetical protein